MKTVRIATLLLVSWGAVVLILHSAPVSAQWRSPYVMPPEEPEFAKRMGARCRALYNAIQERRVSSREVMEGMRREYRRDCEEQESDARQRIYDERNPSRWQKSDDRTEAYRQAREQYQSQRAEQAQTQILERNRTAQHSEGCKESFRVIATKKARTDLTPGEWADLQRFEHNTIARCGR